MSDETSAAALRTAAYQRLRRDPSAREAHVLLYEVEQMLRQPDAALAHLRRALATSRVVTVTARSGHADLTVLALARVARWEANVPLELVVDDRTTVHRFYLDAGDDVEAVLRAPLPPYDVLFNAIAEAAEAQPAMTLAGELAARLGRPALNDPLRVAALSRDRVAATFAASRTILAPPVRRAERAELAAAPVTQPLLLRPLDSQAGLGLARIDDAPALRSYVSERDERRFYVTPFVDYRSADGFFRKYRTIFVDGAAYPCHLAISPHWMIHYYNAPMHEHAWMRDEEARFLNAPEALAAGTLGAALAEIAAAVDVPYFGIDYALLDDGRLLLFEADAAMLVHDSDPPDVFPYKHAAFARISTALGAFLRR